MNVIITDYEFMPSLHVKHHAYSPGQVKIHHKYINQVILDFFDMALEIYLRELFGLDLTEE